MQQLCTDLPACSCYHEPGRLVYVIIYIPRTIVPVNGWERVLVLLSACWLKSRPESCEALD